jgi:hypothetical protein
MVAILSRETTCRKGQRQSAGIDRTHHTGSITIRPVSLAKVRKISTAFPDRELLTIFPILPVIPA